MAYAALWPSTGLSARTIAVRVPHMNILILTCMEDIAEQTMAKFFHEFLIPVCMAHLTQFDGIPGASTHKPQ